VATVHRGPALRRSVMGYARTLVGMATPPGQALQRVCPHCSTISVTPSGACPWCRRSYRRSGLWAVAALMVLQTALFVAALAFLLTRVGDAVQSDIDRQVSVVRRDLDRQTHGLDGRLRRELRSELDARLPAAP
jgi:hypothetical protein